MACARLMRGIASMAKAVTPALFRASIVSGWVRGARNPMKTPSRLSLAISSVVGGVTLTTTSAPQTSGVTVAPASVKWESGISAPSPRARLDAHLEPLGGQLLDDIGHERDAALSRPCLLRHPDG